MLRSDPNAVVRQQALMVWKSVVEHTPATLKRTLSHFLITNQGPYCDLCHGASSTLTFSLPLSLSLTTGVLPKMMHIIIQCLGSSVLDKREVGGKTLGDLVNKLGDRILPDIIPILEEVQSAANLFLPFATMLFLSRARTLTPRPAFIPQGLRSPLSDTRQGVCLGLTEVIASAQKHQIAEYVDLSCALPTLLASRFSLTWPLPSPTMFRYLHIIMPAVSRALYDPLDEVREAAALAFDRLYKSVTSKAIDDIVPGTSSFFPPGSTVELEPKESKEPDTASLFSLFLLRADLLEQLENPEVADYALDGLRQIITLRAAAILPYLIPKLTKPPIKYAPDSTPGLSPPPKLTYSPIC